LLKILNVTPRLNPSPFSSAEEHKIVAENNINLGCNAKLILIGGKSWI